MARQRRIYETAFDCKLSKSEDDINDLDRITNHPLIITHLRSNSAVPITHASSSTDLLKQKNLHQTIIQPSKDKRHKLIVLRSKTMNPNRSKQLHKQFEFNPPKVLLQEQQEQQADDFSNLLQNIESVQLRSVDEENTVNLGYTSLPPLTVPLPPKFQDIHKHEQFLFNINSTSHPTQKEIKQSFFQDMELSINSFLQPSEHLLLNKKKNIFNFKSRSKNFILGNKEFIFKFKDRPAEDMLVPQPRTKSFVREIDPILEFKGRPNEIQTANENRIRRELQASLLEFKLRTSQGRPGYSSTESIATTSSCGSMESLRSSTSEGNRSTTSSESRHSLSLSSHSSDSGSTSSYLHQYHKKKSNFSNVLSYHATKLHILSPISDKSSQELVSETYDNNRNNNSQKTSPEKIQLRETNLISSSINLSSNPTLFTDISVSLKKRRASLNKNHINSVLQSSSSVDAEIQGSDSGISIESRTKIKCDDAFGFQLIKRTSLSLQQHEKYLDNVNQVIENKQDISDLPFNIRTQSSLTQQDTATSGSATSVDLKDLPFDMPKLKRRLRYMQNTESSTSQASSSLSIKDVNSSSISGGDLMRPEMMLNLNSKTEVKNKPTLNFDIIEDVNQKLKLKKASGLNLGLSLNFTASKYSAELVDVELSLERQSWYHGSITRIEAEAILRILQEGSYLVRNSESNKQDYSLSLKSARGFMHMRIQKKEEINAYILGQFSKPFNSIPKMVQHFSVNRLPIRGAEHMCLLYPVTAQLL